MGKLGAAIFIILSSVIVFMLVCIVEKRLEIFKKVLKIQYIIFIPLITILTIFDYIKTGHLLQINNRYGLMLFIAIMFIALEVLMKFLYTIFPCYSRYDIHIDASNHRYVLLIFLSNIYMLFIGTYAILSIIDDFIVDIRFLPL